MPWHGLRLAGPWRVVERSVLALTFGHTGDALRGFRKTVGPGLDAGPPATGTRFA
jgi:hypothetical protein